MMRLLAFVATALGVELARGPGAVTFILSALVGARRWHPLLLLVAIAGGASVSLALPETDTGGKVLHGLSNAPFVLLLYFLLTLIGYAGGRLFHAMRNT